MPINNTFLDWLNSQENTILKFVTELASIPSGSHNLEGIENCYRYFLKTCPLTYTHCEQLRLESNRTLLKLTKNNSAPINLLFCIHMDTVYPTSISHDIRETESHLIGPGVADAKGGLAVLVWTLLALENFGTSSFNWTILINPDEEIGSPYSKSILKDEAKKHDYGFVFEPALPNGNMVSERKGSYNGLLTSTGKSAHAGRSIQDGINAITPLCKLITQLDTLTKLIPDLSCNIGLISGGSALNQVPDHAEVKFNLRSMNEESIQHTLSQLHQTITKIETDAQITLTDLSFRPPKTQTSILKQCIQIYLEAAHHYGKTIGFEATGGVCDGNILNNAGLPTLDTLGPIGEHLHSPEEKVLKKSFVDRISINMTYIEMILEKVSES